MTVATIDQRGLLLGADVLRLPATGAEPATRRRSDGARHVAVEHDPLAGALLARVRHRHRRQQRLRVRVRGSLVELRRPAPISTILPRYMTAAKSEMWRTTERSWAMNTYDRPSSSCRSSSRFTTPAWIDTSSADTGSSSTSSSGSSASARAMPMRWRCPPENSCGNRLACSAFRPTSSISSLTRALIGLPLAASMDHHRLGDDRLHRHPRVQRRVRVLEDDLHLLTQRPDGAARLGQHLLAPELHRARRRRDQPQDQATGGRLAATRLADDAQRLALVHRQRHARHGLDGRDLMLEEPGADRELLHQVGDLEDGLSQRTLLRIRPPRARSCSSTGSSSAK